jgi:hypothetical protein
MWGYFAVAVVSDVDERAAVAGQMKVAPGPPMLVGVNPGPTVELDLEHPHEVVNAIRRQVQKGLPVWDIAFECMAVRGLGRNHLAIIGTRPVTRQDAGVPKLDIQCDEALPPLVTVRAS